MVRRLCGALLALSLMGTAGAQAEGSVEPVGSAWLAKQVTLLGVSQAGVRAEAVHRLSHLDLEARDAIRARLELIRRTRPPVEEVRHILERLARRDRSEPTRGVPALLEQERSDRVLAVVEPLLYLRSLETMPGGEGHALLARFVDLDEGAWEGELLRLRDQLGAQLAPALIAMRAHESARVRKFAVVHAGEPKVVLAHPDPQVLARALAAYSSPLDFTAMPRIARMVGDRRLQVRDAARASIARFGKNAIWQLREVYLEASGQAADKSWDHERTARELYAVLDRARIEEAQTLLERGERAREAGDLISMQRDFDALLAKYPTFADRARLAPGYAAVGASAVRADELAASIAAYRRALRLAPEAEAASRWRAQVAFVSAELSLTRGVVDLPGYEQALRLDPELDAARDAIDRLSGTRVRHARNMKRNAAAAALVLLSVFIALALRRRAPIQHNLF
jgi:hypothetical protein